MPAALPRTVKALGLVSLLTDMSSEMIYPLLPAFLTRSLGAGPAFLGLVEGLAEATAALVKIVSGSVSDRLRRRKPLVLAGYALSSVARPLVAMAAAPWHVLAIRLADRLGKGTRGAPRDALVAEVTAPAERGRAYGFQRAMDHAGALAGPLIASAVLLATPNLRTVFALAAIPALLSVLVVAFGVREAAPGAATTASRPAPPAPPGLPPTPGRGGFSPYLAVLAVFTLGNSSDAFLLLRAQDAGVPLALVPLLWSWHHLVKSAASTHGGVLSDRVGRRRAIVLGWGVYAASYAGFAHASGAVSIWLLFGVYGLFHALTEGPERALVADFAGAAERGRAFGLYHAVTGAMLLPASLLTGLLWRFRGPATALYAGALLAAVASISLWLFVEEPDRLQPRSA